MSEAVAIFLGDLSTDRNSPADLDQLLAVQPDGGAVALVGLRERLFEMFLAAGWQPPAGESVLGGDASAEEDRAALRELGERVRARAAEVREYSENVRGQLDASVNEVRHLRNALKSRAVIEQAKGIVMQKFAIPVDSAWAYLVRESQQSNRKLRDIAAEVVESATRQPSE